jgi:serine/threonine protein phosphatase PrpC
VRIPTCLFTLSNHLPVHVQSHCLPYFHSEMTTMDVAGTTATIAAISMSPSGTNELTILNCGDSRTLVIGQLNSSTEGGAASVVVFETRDHSPDDEIEILRLEQGNAAGLDYSIPQCSTAGSYMVVGDYQYALCRSLEGTVVTSKGIVSDPDVITLDLASSLADRQHCAVVLACDGIYEVMSNEEVGKEIVRMRKEGYKAGDIAKNLCGQALKKGSYDNLSVVVVYLDHIQ